MKENLKKFLEEASKNEELKAKFTAITDKDTAVEKAIALAKEYGITLTEEDFKLDDDDNLSLDELNKVAGGGLCFGLGLSEREFKCPVCNVTFSNSIAYLDHFINKHPDVIKLNL